MEWISRPLWNKLLEKGYQLLDGAEMTKRRNMQVVKLGGGNNNGAVTVKRQLFWRIKRAPKVLMTMASPRRLWKTFSHSYVKFMIRLAGQVNCGSGQFDGMKKIERGNSRRASSKQKRFEEFEGRLVVEIYKSLSTWRGFI